MVYKILTPTAWAQARSHGVLTFSGVDLRDGFVHLCAVDQVARTLALHFTDAADLILVAYDASKLGSDLRWEVSRDGALFPHFYGGLPTSFATDAWKISRGADGVYVLPDLAP